MTGGPTWVARYGVGVALAGLILLGALVVPGFFTRENLTTVLLHVSINAILALGMTFVIVTAGIDLSVGSVLALAGVLTAATLTSDPVLDTVGVGGAAIAAVAVGIGLGMLAGLLNGAVIAWLGVAPFMVTLAAMTIARGLARLYTGGVPIGFPARDDARFAAKVAALDALHVLGGGRIPVPGLPRGFPVPALVMIVLALTAAFVLSRTRFGRYVYAVGGNEEAARLAGVPVRAVKLAVYAIAGACAGLAGVLLVGQLRSGGPDAGMLYELNAIAAAVIGGASLFGGIGTAWGALVGALLIGVLNNALDLLGVQSFWQEIVKGGIILLAVLFDVWTKREPAVHRLPFAVVAILAMAAARLDAQDRLIRQWNIRGPITADTGRAGVLRDYLNAEGTVLPLPGDTAAGGTFQLVAADSAGRVDLNRLAGPANWSVAYAHTYVWSPDERAVLLVMDSDDDLVAHVNGQRVWVHVVPRGIGPGRDTVRVRLAAGWNAVLLKVVNRTGGFDLLGKLAAAPGGGAVDDLRLDPAGPAADGEPRPARHTLPARTVDVGPLTVRGTARWRGDALEVAAAVAATAWGADTIRNARVTLRSGDATVFDTTIAALPPGEAAAIPVHATFGALRASALGQRQLAARARWGRVDRATPLFVDPEPLLRAHAAAVDVFDPRDTLPTPTRLDAALVVPGVFDGLTLDIEERGLGPDAEVLVNGAVAPRGAGRAVLCDPCRAGDALRVTVRPDPRRPLWRVPQARVRDPGFPEYADAFRWTAPLGHPIPDEARPDAAAWLRDVGTPAYAARRAAAAAAFHPAAAALRRDTLWLVGNAHIDAAWLWRWQETVDVIRNTWRTSLKLAEIFPGYVFAGSSAAFYDAMDRLEPALADSLVAAAERGAWAPVGGWWVEPDMNLSSGESLVRQGLYGQRYFQRRFGRRSTVAWTPDTFGYPWTLPQILTGSGFTAFVTQKIRWNDSTEFPHNVFWWESRDGTRLLSYIPYGYTHDLDPATLVEERVEDAARSGIGHQIVLYGVGDHGGGPTIRMLERAEQLRRVPAFPAARYAGPEAAVAAVARAEPDTGYPVWRDELYLEYHRGTLTSQAAMKRRNRQSEVRLQTTEALAALDTAPYPRAALEAAWRRVLFNQFHDILPGSGIDSIYLDAHATYDTAWTLLDSLTSASFARLRGRMDTRGRGAPVVAFNPLGWSRGGWAAVAGATRPETTWVFVDSVPALGARVVHLPEASQPRAWSRLAAPAAGPTWIENAFLRVEVDTTTGAVVRMYDKRAGREVLAPGARANVLQVLDDRPAQWDAWNLMPNPETWEVTAVTRTAADADARAARLTVERTWGTSTFRQVLVLGREADYLDIENDVAWHERRKLLKVGFGFAVTPDSATFEVPYGTIARSGRPRTQAERAKWEVPGQRWADVSADGYGVSVLNDAKYGWDYRDGVLRLSLLKAPIWPDSTADRGRHRFRFAVLPHAGDWTTARIERRAAEYNVPLLASVEAVHTGSLGRSASFGSGEGGGASIVWLKRAEDANRFVLRLVEWHGRDADVAVALPCAAAAVTRANLLEDPGAAVPVAGRAARLSLRAHEIATFLVECRP